MAMGMTWLLNDSADGDGLMVASYGASLDLSQKPSPIASQDASLNNVWPAMLPAILTSISTVILDGGKL
jgi:hypothetical protein